MDRWKDIESLFEEALELDPEERAKRLESVAARDPEVYREVVSLLEAHERADDFFEGLSARFVSPLFMQLDAEPPVPEQVGAYRVVRELGRGGMSTVFLAERADGQFEQQVALKVLRYGMRAEEHVHRFLSERQILASLSHPHIARLLDGGITDDGRPYFVMEYVEGEPIDRYCDARRLSIKERLHLFLVVLEAVQYAHRNLVVHRDLKPSNILVNGEGQAKLLDFGIAKLLDTNGENGLTRTGERWMTPEYAAPEQVKGERVTTATDVYQLGVVLYRLLTGHRPYRLGTGSTYEIERAVCEEEPTRPSTVVNRVEEVQQGEATVRITPEAVSQTRDTELPTLRRTLAGDLDAILLKALRKEPEARYVSAEAFKEDIKRYLAGLPVEARRDSLSYRARKFIGRHRWGLATAVVIAGLLVGYALTATLQARQIARERDRARLEAAKAEQVTELLIDLFKVSDPQEMQGDTLTTREVLERGVRRVTEELANQPEVQARALGVIGRVYQSLGLYEESVATLEQAVSLLPTGSPHPDVARARLDLGNALKGAGRFDEAEAVLRRAVQDLRALPDAREMLAEVLTSLARLLIDLDRFAEADSLYGEVLTFLQAAENTEGVARTLGHLALLRQNQKEYAAAESLYTLSLHQLRRVFGERHTEVASTLTDLAGLHADLGRFDTADSLYRRALGILESVLGDEHPDVAKALNNLGLMHLQAGNLEEAEPLLRRALAIKTALLGEDHPSLTYTYINLASVLHDRGRFDEAEALCRKALAIDLEVYGADHPDVASDLMLLASILHDKGDLAEADRMYGRALTIWRNALPSGYIGFSTSLLGRARVWMDLGRPREAEPLLRESLEIRLEAVGTEHWGTAQVRGTLGACLAAMGRFKEAEALLLQSLGVLNAEFGDQDHRTQRVLEDLAMLYEAVGRPDQAASYRGRRWERPLKRGI